MADCQRLLDDLASSAFAHGVEQGFWQLVEMREWLVYVRLIAPDGRSYLAEFNCALYSEEPILCRFIDAETRMCVASAWPQGDPVFNGWVKFSANDLFICWEQDREAVRRHQEWKDKRVWARKPNQIVAYLDFLRGLLHVAGNGYQRQTPKAA